jgi:uncharacterized membrane protein YjjP (DUF1212 family)
MLSALEPHKVELLKALVFGLVFSGFVASAFQYLTDRKPSFTLLQTGGWSSILAVPVVVLMAPFIILRNTIQGRRYERRNVFFVWLATVIACLWGMASGRVVLDAISRFLV